MVRDLRYQGGEIVSFSEQVPLVYDGLHEQLGTNWINKNPSELEQLLLHGVDVLSRAPILAQDLRDTLGAQPHVEERLRAVGEGAELVRYYPLRDGTEIAVTPLYAFEQPDILHTLFENAAPDRVLETFARVRTQPGFAIAMNGSEPVAEEMVRVGLVQAPTVVGADGTQRAFIVIPYGLDPAYLSSKKQVLDRALSLIACVRCGEISGGATSVRFPDRLLASLMDPERNYTLGPHSSTPRQYAPLIRKGVIETVGGGSRLAARLIPTPDNLEAVELARALLQRRGEGIPERGNEREAANLLFTGREYLAPIETIHQVRTNSPRLTGSEVQDLWEQAMGRVL